MLTQRPVSPETLRVGYARSKPGKTGSRARRRGPLKYQPWLLDLKDSNHHGHEPPPKVVFTILNYMLIKPGNSALLHGRHDCDKANGKKAGEPDSRCGKWDVGQNLSVEWLPFVRFTPPGPLFMGEVTGCLTTVWSSERVLSARVSSPMALQRASETTVPRWRMNTQTCAQHLGMFLEQNPELSHF